mmetsp:Transcript_10011/g.30790  ORF Transcript_10011/g.30790 Transcript_10011/m.30790 type:complete len:224 (-) Transcript_10011:499-1170(-)
MPFSHRKCLTSTFHHASKLAGRAIDSAHSTFIAKKRLFHKELISVRCGCAVAGVVYFVCIGGSLQSDREKGVQNHLGCRTSLHASTTAEGFRTDGRIAKPEEWSRGGWNRWEGCERFSSGGQFFGKGTIPALDDRTTRLGFLIKAQQHSTDVLARRCITYTPQLAGYVGRTQTTGHTDEEDAIRIQLCGLKIGGASNRIVLSLFSCAHQSTVPARNEMMKQWR